MVNYVKWNLVKEGKKWIKFMDDKFNNSKSRLKGFKLKKGNYASIWRNINGMDVFLVLGGDGLLDTFIRLTYKLRSDS